MNSSVFSYCKINDCGSVHDPIFPSCSICAKHTMCNVCGESYPSFFQLCSYCKNSNNKDDLFEEIRLNGNLEPLLDAISKGKIDFYGQKASIDFRGPFGFTPINYAILYGHDNEDLTVLEDLLKKGANPNALTWDGIPAIFYCLDTESSIATEQFKLLIKYGANHEIKFSNMKWEDSENGKGKRDELKKFINTFQSENAKG